MRKKIHEKLTRVGRDIGGPDPHEVEPFDPPLKTKDGASSIEEGTVDGKSVDASLGTTQHPHKNLGKYLHPKKGSIHGRTVNASEVNHTVDANTGGARVRPGY